MKKDNYTKIIEGNYTFFQQNKPYSDELFKVYEHINKESVMFSSEIITRLPTGELLKILTHYEVNKKWQPVNVVIKKAVGIKSVTETFSANILKNHLYYSFEYENKKKTFDKNIIGAYQISTPSFATSLMCAQHRNVTALGRTRYTMVVSDNDWEPIGAIKEKVIYLASDSTDKTTIKINDTNLEAKKILMYQHDTHENIQEEPGVFYISRHMSIPYLVQPTAEVKIQINYLKKLTNQYSDEGLPSK